MGKKARKTRWRALTITGEHSDSEESNTHSGSHQIPKSYQEKPYYSKFSYSSQSTPVRNRFQNDIKSTRSSSTNSENKITFNEDEYTRITTPRQDVLFKKGYLNKPKTYQTQTSTGNSTISTGNSTGNGTPDHQSADGTEGTDLEYESQFVFPNGFVDHNGIYYVNSYEPYPPLMVYNASFCYPEYHPSRSKRYSTGSLAESTSPNNEEASQDMSQSGGETVNISEFNPVFNVMYPNYNYYSNGIPAPTEVENGALAEPRKVKKRRRRKVSKPIPDGSTTSDEDESDEALSEIENRIIQGTHRPQTTSPVEENPKSNTPEETPKAPSPSPVEKNEEKCKTSLKADAKEFIPRSYRTPDLSIPHYINFIPYSPYEVPSNFNPTFVPPGIPINFIAPDHKFVPINFIPNYHPKQIEKHQTENVETEENVEKEKEPVEQTKEEQPPPKIYAKNIDIERIVSKLEEAAKEQRFYENRKQKFSPKFNKQKGRLSYRKEVRKRLVNQEEKQEENQEVIVNGHIEEKAEVEVIEEKTVEVPKVHNENTKSPVTNKPERLTQNEIREKSPQKTNGTLAKTSRPKFNRQNSDGNKNYITRETLKNYKSQDFKSFNGKSIGVKNVNVNQQGENCSNTRSRSTPEKSPMPIKRIETPKNSQIQKGPNQWISVSRKKRRNKSAQENDLEIEGTAEEFTEETQNIEEDGFESYDVNLLEDVVVVSAPAHPLDNKPLVPEEIKQDLEVAPEEIKTESDEFDKLIKSLEELEANSSKKKKVPQKSKRIMITDVDLPGLVETPKKTPVKIVKKIEAKKEVDEIEIVKKDLEVIKKTEEETKIENTSETPEKKKNKNKKKKGSKKGLSKSNSSANLNNADDSYDFLLTNSLLEHEKTNVEISEELDKIIQRGMYSNLQEKIKSLNIVAANDGFFKTVSMNNIKSEKANFFKTNDLGTILKNTTNIFQQRRPSMDASKNFAKISDSEASTSGSFLDVANVQKDPGIEKEKQYPITKAVKDWMIKTRETTPEVELLKSPSTIMKELRPKNGFNSRAGSPGVISSEEEVTIWSLTPENSIDDDLLDCWDDGGLSLQGNQNDKVEDGEDALEVYESKYGNNEDYLKLKAEIEERKRKGNFPSHAHLPLRAICCSLM